MCRHSQTNTLKRALENLFFLFFSLSSSSFFAVFVQWRAHWVFLLEIRKEKKRCLVNENAPAWRWWEYEVDGLATTNRWTSICCFWSYAKKNVAFKSTKVSIVESGLCSCDRREKKKKKWFPSSSHKSESKNYRLLERNTQKPGQQQSSHRSSSTHRIKTVFFSSPHDALPLAIKRRSNAKGKWTFFLFS